MATTAGRARPIQRMCEGQGIAIVEGAGLRRGHAYRVGGRVFFLVPEELVGVDVREGIVARQWFLLALERYGRERIARAMAAVLAGDAGGPPPAPGPGVDVAAD